MIDRTQRDLLKERYRFIDWAGRSELPKDRQLRRFAFAGDELPGWTLERAARQDAGPAPPRLTSFWRRGASKTALRVDVFECASADAAHEYLVEALGEFQSTAIGRRTDVKLGDVAFGTDTVALFARANLVVLVRNADREVVSVTAIAQAIDALVVGRLRQG